MYAAGDLRDVTSARSPEAKHAAAHRKGGKYVLPNVAKLDVQPIAKLFRALGDETRVRIVALLTHGELCVCHIETALGLSQPTASRQLGTLRAAGLVTRRRVGSWIYYQLASPAEAECGRVLAAIKQFAGQETLHRDLVRLRKSTGPGAPCT